MVSAEGPCQQPHLEASVSPVQVRTSHRDMQGARHCAGQHWAPEPKDTLPLLPHLRRETSMFTTNSAIKQIRIMVIG